MTFIGYAYILPFSSIVKLQLQTRLATNPVTFPCINQ